MSRGADDPRRAQLRRLRAIAVALLLAMLCGFAVSHAMGGQGIWAWVRAFCEAACVGALADWFAVVALFRRPLGLPIPHTAIIPSHKDRVADSLAGFVRDHFLEPESLLARLREFDPAARLGRWLEEPRQVRMAARISRIWARRALALLDEQAVRAAIQSFVMRRLRRWDAAATAGEVLGLLTRDGRHQALLDEALGRLGAYLSADQVKARAAAMLARYARQEWPRIVGTVNLVKPVDEIAQSMAERLAQALLDELHDILTQSDHPVRKDYEIWIGRYLERLRDDPALAAEVDSIKQRLIGHSLVQDYVQGLWDEIRKSLRRDLAREDSALAGHLEQMLLALGRQLTADPGLRKAINEHVLAGAGKLAVSLRSGITEHIGLTVKGWDERRLVDELELSVGRDLQYIRFNGTLVGGLIGLTLHGLVTWLA